MNRFGTTCLVVSNGKSFTHIGTACQSDNQLLNYGNFYAVKNCMSRVLITAPLATAKSSRPAVPTRTVAMKIMLLSATGDPTQEQRLESGRRALQMWGVPYTEYIASPAFPLDDNQVTGV